MLDRSIPPRETVYPVPDQKRILADNVAWRAWICALVLCFIFVLSEQSFPLGFDLEKFESVFPREFAKHSRLGVLLEYRQRFAGYALAAHPLRRRIVVLTDAAAVPILTGAIATKDELVLMTRQKIRRERRIA
jgi:hypothetical protein